MSGAPGFPAWYELPTGDPDVAIRFYGDVVGWGFERSPMPEVDYRIGTIPGGRATVGVLGMAPDAQAGSLPRWLTYFDVDNVDAAVNAATTAGASVQMPATDLPQVGRMAMLADPEGNPFYVIHRQMEAPAAFNCAVDAPPGSAVWNELSAVDADRMLDFYQALFGWRQNGGMPMGDLGEYRFLFSGETGVGAIMPVPPGGRPGWMPYFLADEIDAVAGRIAQAGGSVLQGPDPIPGDLFAVVAADPGGARFGFVAPRRS